MTGPLGEEGEFSRSSKSGEVAQGEAHRTLARRLTTWVRWTALAQAHRSSVVVTPQPAPSCDEQQLYSLILLGPEQSFRGM